MSRTWKGGSTRAWRRTRQLVLERDGYVCRLALPGTWISRRGELMRCAGRADSVHHIHGKAATGDDPAYLIAACRACNMKVGNPAKASKSDPAGRSATRW